MFFESYIQMEGLQLIVVLGGHLPLATVFGCRQDDTGYCLTLSLSQTRKPREPASLWLLNGSNGWLSGVGPEHAFLKDMERAEYHAVTDDDALAAFQEVSKLEGIIPALETSHALAYLNILCQQVPDGTKIVLNFSGRGDKDVNSVMEYLNL